jgi:cytochrome c oxidase subunit 3|tara:strand:- start:5827 stop:6513 length:687 start_codon:yes stop_codon:yes gene_type:complete
MSYILYFLGLLMVAIVWWLVKQTVGVEPWAADGVAANVRSDGVRSPVTARAIPNVKLGLGVFLAVATSLFALFISAYSIRMEYPDWRPVTEPAVLWINTGVLVLSSVLLQYALFASRRQRKSLAQLTLIFAIACSVGFIVGQLYAWEQLMAAGTFISNNPASGFFYVMTAVHGLHLIGGLFALGRSVIRVFGSNATQESTVLGIELCAIYWHYLLVIWLTLFTLILAT